MKKIITTLVSMTIGLILSAQIVAVTIQVDMQEQTIHWYGVHIAGSFQGWSPGSTPMADMGGGIYAITVPYLAGQEIKYKFINGITWNGQETVPAPCSNYEGNRYFTVPETSVTLAPVCFGSCNPCMLGTTIDVTFQVDMSLQIISGQGVFLTGHFNSWSATANPMTHIENNVYEATVSLNEFFLYGYKFINGLVLEIVPGECNTINGNRLITCPAVDTIMPLVCFGECGPCIIPTHIFDLKVNLEGPFNGTDMNTDLYDLGVIPIGQPYDTQPWNCNGTETITASPEADVVDWVILELRDVDGDASIATPDKFLDHQAVLLLSDGSIVQPDGISLPEYSGPVFNNLYVVVYHRNHLAVNSSAALVETKGSYVYDFTDDVSKAWQNGQIALGGGMYGMIGGDSDASGTIDDYDKGLHWSLNAGNAGYFGSDLNLNTQVNNPDKNDLWEINYGTSFKIPGGYFLGCGTTLFDFRDKQIYNTVQIGTQCWMAENLNIGERIDGVNDQNDNGTFEKYCYDDLDANCDTYGGLYQWNEMMEYSTISGSQGLCMEGWHVPTDEEWKILEGNVDSQFPVGDPEWDDVGERGFDAGIHLRSTTGWDFDNGDDAFGFTTLPSGKFVNGEIFDGLGGVSAIWTSTEKISGSASWYREIDYTLDGVCRNWNPVDFGFSVRCLKNNQPPLQPSQPTPNHGAVNQPVILSLSWSCSDPEGDDLTYNIYFGTDINPPLIQTIHPDTFYSPEILLYDANYYWKIVAYDIYGDSTEGNIWPFTTKFAFECGDILLDERNWQTYNTVQIDNLCWMAKNMNIGTMIDSTTTPYQSDLIEKHCYRDNVVNCDDYGGLYTWDEAMQGSWTAGDQGICPEGWHIPTRSEFLHLRSFIDPNAGGKLKEQGTSHWLTPNTGATDQYNFTGLPGGRLHANWIYQFAGEVGLFWTSTQEDDPDPIDSYSYYLLYNSTDFGGSWELDISSFSVRCIRNYLNQHPNQPSNPSPEHGSIDRPVELSLSWTCTDPYGDPLTYDVYFGETNPPALVSTGQTASSFNPGSLNYNTTYFWKITAHDDYLNSTEGPVWSFTTTALQIQPCPGTPTVSYGGKIYNTLQIGIQCWLKENLDIGNMINGNDNQTNDGVIEKYCYDNVLANCDEYGGLYQWDEMMQYNTIPGVQGICPPNWHLPTDYEWTVLVNFLGGGGVAGGKLKEAGLAHWFAPNTGATNISQFTGLPGGYRFTTSSFVFQHQSAFFWSSDELNYETSWFRQLYSYNENIYRGNTQSKGNGFSVRCVKENVIIGIEYQGGIIAYILQPGDPGYVEGEVHGLIAAATDQSNDVHWGCSGTWIGGTASAFGTGAANTAAIVAVCGEAGIAARLCDELELNGYNDWFLPSKDELNKLYQNSSLIGGFYMSGSYWSSSEYSSYFALHQSFTNGGQGHINKTNYYRVRAVRAF